MSCKTANPIVLDAYPSSPWEEEEEEEDKEEEEDMEDEEVREDEEDVDETKGRNRRRRT